MDADGTSGERVSVREFDGAQAQPDVFMGPVQVITGNGAAGGGKVQSDLVGASGQGNGLDEGPISAGFEQSKAGFGGFAFAKVDAMSAWIAGSGSEGQRAGPTVLPWDTIGDGEVAFGDIPGGKEASEGGDGTAAFGHQQDTCRGGIETVDEADELEGAASGPPLAGINACGEREVQIATDVFLVLWAQHPAGRFVDGEDAAVLKEDGDAFTVRQFDMIRFRHGERLERLRKWGDCAVEEAAKVRGDQRPQPETAAVNPIELNVAWAIQQHARLPVRS